MRINLLILLIIFSGVSAAQTMPRTASGKPDLQGIWQVQNRAAFDLQDHVARHNMPAGRGVVVGGEIPYQNWALEQKAKNYDNRATDDPLAHCFLPGTPRIMYMDYPFHIFQNDDHVAITFEWTQIFRMIYTNGEPAMFPGIVSWMGSSRGNWEDDVLVVKVTDFNDKTWFDAVGNFHSDALQVTERYKMLNDNTIEYEATIEDAKVFTRPWTIRMKLHRQTDMDRILEYQCQAEREEANGAFERDHKTWYPAPIPTDNEPFDYDASIELPTPEATGEIPTHSDGTPNISGFYMADAGGANYGLEARVHEELMPTSRGHIVDPPDGTAPYQVWARAEAEDRYLPHRGYDDPTAHCFPAGVPRSSYVPAPFHILQFPGHVVILHERMSYRLIPLDGREHLPDNMRLWQGDSVGRWEGRSLVVESSNFNGRSWLNEAGDLVSHAMTVVETFTPVSNQKIIWRATVTDPIAFTRPWTMEMPFDRQDSELLEVACLEDEADLPHLKDIRDDYREKMNKN